MVYTRSIQNAARLCFYGRKRITLNEMESGDPNRRLDKARIHMETQEDRRDLSVTRCVLLQSMNNIIDRQLTLEEKQKYRQESVKQYMYNAVRPTRVGMAHLASRHESDVCVQKQRVHARSR
jgi:hypothetical protein